MLVVGLFVRIYLVKLHICKHGLFVRINLRQFVHIYLVK